MRVTGFIVLVLCLCGLAAHVSADPSPARILIGACEVPLSPAPVFDGSRVLAPPAVIPALGASYASSGSSGSITVTSASGESGTIRTVIVDGLPMVPMDKLIGLLGGDQTWDTKTKTLKLLSHLQSVEFDNDVLKINCTLPARPSTRSWDGKIIVDVAGARVTSEAREVYVGGATVARARLGQYNDTTSRVVLDLNKNAGCELQTQGAAAQILMKVADGLDVPPALSPTPAPVTRFSITGITVQPIDKLTADVVINTSARPTASRDFSVQPPRIVLGMPADFDASCAIVGSCDLVRPDLTKTASGAKLTLELSRPLDYEVEFGSDTITVHLRPPDKSGGTLAGKLVVIDPGHGGKQKGATSAGISEKSLNLQIARTLAAALQREGARTLLTRDGDGEMGLVARPTKAMSEQADFFISIHCNSNLVPNSASGIETYFHRQEPSPKILAYAIHDNVCKLTGMRDGRPRSDQSLYSSGLCVLRTLYGSGLPGILLECGYVNNSSDRAKLADSKYQAKLAAGIVAGLKAYVEGGAVE